MGKDSRGHSEILREGIKRKMKVLHLLYESKGDYFGIGGVGIRAYEIYGYLKDRHDITLLCKKYPGAKNKEIEGVRHIFAGAESTNLSKALLSYAYHSARFVRKFGKDFDVIIEEFSPAIPTFLNFYKKRPVVLQIQGYTGRLYYKKYNPVYALSLNILEHIRPGLYKNFILVNKATSGKFSLKSSSHVEFIPNGVSPELLDAASFEGDYILYLGRIDIYGKGLDLLISAYAEFSASRPDVRLVIAGDGRGAGDFEAMLLKLPEHIRKNIEMAGWVSGDKKTETIKRALCVVFPSRHEVQPIAVLEAMACGKVLVVSDIPELNYVTDCGAGVSFRSGDAASLAQAMRNMAANESRTEMGLKGRDWVRDLTWDKIALKFENFLRQVAEKHP